MISIVLYGRNDSYGYNLHKRAAISLNCIAELLTDGNDEIIFVDYNTPDDFPTFPEAIADTLTPKAKSLLRVLRVRPSQHERFRELTHLVCLEPVARNVAIRRSNPANRWILSTNTDMVFVPRKSGSLSEIARELEDAYYHLPRFEVPETLWESANRLDPAGTIASFAAWGRDFHLNEIVYAFHPDVRYDGPGDFQLALRSDLWRIQGFHEGMLLGWHVDSNIARRLALLPRQIGDVVDDLYGYHCDHTRQVTPAHRPRGLQNDQKVFFENVTLPDIPEQVDTWGLNGEEVEEISLGVQPFLTALSAAIPKALDDPTKLGYTVESFDRMDYSSEHVLPFLIDSIASYPRNTTIGWLGAKGSLLRGFARAWKELAFSAPILVLDQAGWLGDTLPPGCMRASLDDICERGNVFVFDWGKPDDAAADNWLLEKDPVVREVARAFRKIVRYERERVAKAKVARRRFIGINAINNTLEGIFNNHIGAALTPLATHMRQGFLSDTRDLITMLYAGQAGCKLADRFETLPGADGYVFYGPYLDLDSGAYRVTVRFSDVRFETEDRPSLGLEVVSNSRLLAYREVNEHALCGGEASLDFYIPTEISEAPDWPRIEFRLKSPGSLRFTVHYANLEEIDTASDVKGLREVDIISLLVIGPAGQRKGRVVQSRAGIADLVTYGPYFWLPAGRYEAKFRFSIANVDDEASIRAYVAHRLGREALGRASVLPKKTGIAECSAVFDIGHDVPHPDEGLLEFLVWSTGRIDFTLEALRLKPLESVAPEISRPVESNVLPLLNTDRAGKRLHGTVLALGDAPGPVFRGPALPLPAGSQRLHLSMICLDERRFPVDDSGITIAALCNNRPLAARPITRKEMEQGKADFDFEVPGSSWGEIELFLRTTGLYEIAVTSARFAEEATLKPAAHSRPNFIKLMDVGSAGRWTTKTTHRDIAIRSNLGVDDVMAYGPYISLEPGAYEVEFELFVKRTLGGMAVTVDVARDFGTRVVASETLAPEKRGMSRVALGDQWASVKGVLSFEATELEKPTEASYEFRVWVDGTVDCYLAAVYLTKVPVADQASEKVAATSP